MYVRVTFRSCLQAVIFIHIIYQKNEMSSTLSLLTHYTGVKQTTLSKYIRSIVHFPIITTHSVVLATKIIPA